MVRTRKFRRMWLGREIVVAGLPPLESQFLRSSISIVMLFFPQLRSNLAVSIPWGGGPRVWVDLPRDFHSDNSMYQSIYNSLKLYALNQELFILTVIKRSSYSHNHILGLIIQVKM